MTTVSSVKKWGNSLAVRIPAAIALDLGLSAGSKIRVASNGVRLTVRPEERQRASLDELVKAITPRNRHREVDWGEAAGKEIW